MAILELGVREEGSKEVALREPGSRNGAGRLETGDRARGERYFIPHTENEPPHAGNRRTLVKSGMSSRRPTGSGSPCGNGLNSTVVCLRPDAFWQGSGTIRCVAL